MLLLEVDAPPDVLSPPLLLLLLAPEAGAEGPGSSSASASANIFSSLATASSLLNGSVPRERSSWKRLSTRRRKYPNMMDAA